MSDWTKEFGRLFDVPSVISATMADVSYGNDTAPSFTFRRQTDAEMESGEIVLPRLWVNHPDPEQRDHYLEARFVITYKDEQIWEGGDLTTAYTLMAALQRFHDIKKEKS